MERSEIQAKIWEAYESGSLISACAWCDRLCLDGRWVDPPHGALMTIDASVTLSHGICPSCAEVQAAEAQHAESSAPLERLRS